MKTTQAKNDDVATSHIPFLDGLRALCAIYVVLHHWWFQYCYNQPLLDRWSRLCTHGRWSVDVFMVISGFCLTIPVSKYGALREGAIAFMKRRAWRILPPYYFAIALSLILIGTVIGSKSGTRWDLCIPVSLSGLLSHLLLLQDLRAPYYAMINAPMWSISVEWRIYFLFPLFAWLLCRNREVIVLLVAGALSVIYYQVLLRFHSGYLNINASPHYILLFSFGLVASSLVYTPNRQTWLRYVGICLMFALAILVRVTVHYYGSKPGNGLLRTILQDIDVGLIAAGLISYAAIKQASLLTRALSWAPLAFIGTFAYSIYLIHLPLLQCEWLLLRGFRISDELAFGIGCIVGIPVIVGLSYGFHCLFERPFLRRKVVICQTKS